MQKIASLFVSLCLLAALGHIDVANGETPGERFRKVIEREAEYCATHKIKPTNRRCDITKLKPADPLATEEGRFAHSIKIPNPVPEDSGYQPGMTPEQYFDHLCKTEAGEFIYKTVEKVEGLYMMRPSTRVPYGNNHLYALENPYGGSSDDNEPEIWLVRPSRYLFLETPYVSRNESDRKRQQLSSSVLTEAGTSAKYARYFGYDGRERGTMQRVYDASLKSRYGYTWRGIARPHDRELGIAGGEVIILDLQTREILGAYRGYAKFEIHEGMGAAGLQWANACPTPPNMGGGAHLAFIVKVLKPFNEHSLK
jgi:hypothetical protein